MQKKMITVFYTVIIALITVVFVGQSIFVCSNAYNKHISGVKYQADLIRMELENELNSYLDMSLNVTTNSLITERMRQRQTYDYSQAVSDHYFLKKYFSSFNEIESYMPDQFCIYTMRENFSESVYIGSLSELQEKPVWSEIEKASDYGFVWDYTVVPDEDIYLSLYRKIRTSTETLGYLEIKIPHQKLIKCFDNVMLDKNSAVTLVNKDGDLIYSYGEKALREKSFVLPILNGDTLTFSTDIYSAMHDSIVTVIVFFGIYIVLLVAMRFFSSKIVSKIMMELNNFISVIKDDDMLLLNSHLIDAEGDSDVDQVKMKFKELITRNNELRRDIEISNRNKQKAELNFLQYSINPHLLYNSLSCIKWCVMDRSEDEIMTIIDNMTEYYRIVLAGGEDFITISEELRLIKLYVDIMDMVHCTKTGLNFHIDEDLKNTYIIKMLLQPIVENAILHGISGVENPRVDIKIEASGDKLTIVVSDNGHGMSPQTVEELLLGGSGTKKRNGYGLKNVKERIKCYYGENAGIYINSAEKQGTEITVSIRLLEDLPG